MSSPIDWELAAKAAALVGGGGGDGSPLPGDVEATCTEAVKRIARYTDLIPRSPIPAPETVDRTEWARTNLTTMADVLDPVAAKLGDGLGPLSGPVTTVGGTLLGVEAGLLAGWMGGKVLGQYDIRLLEPEDPADAPPERAPRLLLVAPNLRGAAEALDVDLERLVQWVAVHEVTHAVQFTAVPWLRPHLGGLLRELLASATIDIDVSSLLRLPRVDDLKALLEAARGGDLVRLVAGDERRQALDRIQAAMALVEGHAELVMDAVGEELLGDLSDLRSALDRRRSAGRPPLMAWLERLLGLELKLRQYELGRSFCDEVVELADVATLHRAFEAPELLPTLAELEDPDAWLRRAGDVPIAVA